MPYTKEDIDAYIEYSHILYVEVLQAFMPKVNLEGADSKDMRAYGEAVGNSIGIQSIILQVYASMLEPFNVWMNHDCTLTKHKTRAVGEMQPLMGTAPSEDRFIVVKAPGKNRKNGKRTTSDNEVFSTGGSKTSGIQEAIEWANAPKIGEAKHTRHRKKKMTREQFHRALIDSLSIIPWELRNSAHKTLMEDEERLYKEYLNRNDDKAVKGPDGLGKEMK